jgi:hypothetical protein
LSLDQKTVLRLGEGNRVVKIGLNGVIPVNLLVKPNGLRQAGNVILR